MMKPTPHLIAAAVIVLIAIGVGLPALIAGGGSHPITGTVARVAAPTPTLVPAAAAVDPLVASFARLGEDNPFTLRKTGFRKGPRVNLPPPPPLEPPAPPLLPLPEAAP